MKLSVKVPLYNYESSEKISYYDIETIAVRQFGLRDLN